MALPVAVLSRLRDAAAFIQQSLQYPGRHRSQKLTSLKSEHYHHPPTSLNSKNDTHPPTPLNSANDTHPLTSLPDELLVMITSDLNNADLLCLKQASRRFYCLLGTSARDLDDDECNEFLKALRLEMWDEGAARDSARGKLDPLISCSTCCDFHPRAAFSKAQLAQTSESRGCMMSERKLAICKHTSITLLDLLDLYLETAEREWDESDANGQLLPFYQKHHHMCFHRDKTHGNFAIDSFRKLRVQKGQDGEYQAKVDSSFALGTNLLPVKYPFQGDVSNRSEATAYVNLIRRRLIDLAVQLCPHASTADHRIYTRFDISCALADLCDVITAVPPTPTWQGTCGNPDCTMTFYFRRLPWNVHFNHMGGTGIVKRDEVKMYVDHCTLPLPIHAHAWAWRAHTVADDTLEPAEATSGTSVTRETGARLIQSIPVPCSSCRGPVEAVA